MTATLQNSTISLLNLFKCCVASVGLSWNSHFEILLSSCSNPGATKQSDVTGWRQGAQMLICGVAHSQSSFNFSHV